MCFLMACKIGFVNVEGYVSHFLPSSRVFLHCIEVKFKY